MKYEERLPENEPLAIVRRLVQEFDRAWRVRPLRCDEAGCSGPYVDVIVGYSRLFGFLWRRPIVCATIEVRQNDARMKIAGDAYKDEMVCLAQRIENEIREWHSNYEVAALFLSHAAGTWPGK